MVLVDNKIYLTLCIYNMLQPVDSIRILFKNKSLTKSVVYCWFQIVQIFTRFSLELNSVNMLHILAETYRQIFPFKYFNVVQTEILDHVLHDSK